MLGTLFLWAGAAAPLAGPAVVNDGIDARLASHLSRVAPDDHVSILVYFEKRYDALAMQRETASLPRHERAERVRMRLRDHANREQRGVQRELQRSRSQDANAVTRDRQLWIVNARRVTCRADEVETLALADGVERIVWDPVLDDLADVGPAAASAAGGTFGGSSASRATPNVVGHQAPDLWRIGIDGQGVLILNIDSGVNKDHPDLVSSIWANPGEIDGNGLDDDGNGYVDDVWGWDFASGDASPYDNGHGTNVAGILVGDGTNNGGSATGMAPGATMAVARVATEGQLLEAYQYAITIGADVVSSSHSVKWGNRPDYHAFRAAMEMELAAGIVHANSIGNRGLQVITDPVPWNISTPGNCPGPWVHPQQLVGGRASVVSVGGILLDGDALYAFGSQGPSAWEDITASDPNYAEDQDPAFWDYPRWNGQGPGLLKPDIAAYTSVRTTNGPSGYAIAFGGTSAATPHVGGAFALLLDQTPHALPRQLSHAIQVTARDLEAPGKDVRTGAGKLLAYDAALRLRSLVTLLPQDPAPGESFQLQISGPRNAPYLLLIGSSLGSFSTSIGLELDLADPAVLLSGVHTGLETPESLSVHVPANAALSGLTVHFQTLTDERSGHTGRWLASLPETLSVR